MEYSSYGRPQLRRRALARPLDDAGTLDSIIANDFIGSAGQAYVAIAPTDVAFKSDVDCGTWIRIA